MRAAYFAPIPYFSSTQATQLDFPATKVKWKEWVLQHKQKQKQNSATLYCISPTGKVCMQPKNNNIAKPEMFVILLASV